MPAFRYEADRKTLEELADLYTKGRLDLSPAFQRDSVWQERDREKLIESVLRGYPLPSIFLHKQRKDGIDHYSVIDGKQRLETLLSFICVRRGGLKRAFVERLDPEDESRTFEEEVTWRSLNSRKEQHLLLSYDLQVMTVEGSLSEIRNLFVRLNSTGKALTRAEKRNAKWFDSPMLARARKIAGDFDDFFRANKIISATQRSRMKDIELVCDLLVSAHFGKVVSGRTALDKTLDTKALTGASLADAARETSRGLANVQRMFPDLRTTRFHALSDFYTLAVLVQRLDRQKLVLNDPDRNEIAMRLLERFGAGVDAVAQKAKSARGADASEEMYRDYYLTVREGTSEERQRKRREAILASILEPVFEEKDAKRLFTPEQRRIIWASADEKRCGECEKPLTWSDVTFDHVFPHSRGGRTSVANAALLCHRHNAAKGARV